MDNKLTKKRLNNMFSYEWLAMICVAVIVILAWELIYSVAGVRLTDGQEFFCTFDYNVYCKGTDKIEQAFKPSLSYDVLVFKVEQNYLDSDVLNSRILTQSTDVIFTDLREQEDGNPSRAECVVATGVAYDFEKMLSDLKEYIKEYNTDRKIEELFLSRMKKDNRFRTELEKQDGLELEKQRFFNLNQAAVDLENLIGCGKDIFYTYEGKIYGIDLGKLPSAVGKRSISEFLCRQNAETLTDTSDIVLMVCDYHTMEGAKDLQYEDVCFVNSIVKTCSDIIG